MKGVLALDQGTTSSRAIIFDRRGRMLGAAQREFRQYFPKPGWVEHDPLEIWNSQLATARAALKRSGLKPADLAAVGITNQRETTVLWDRTTGRPLHRAIVWQDRRTASDCEALKRRGWEPLFRRRTGLVLDPYFSGTKLAWLLDHVKGARTAARAGRLAFGTIDTWLAWQLSGGRLHITDASNASRTLLFNIRTGAWDDDLLAALRIPHSLLPEVRDSSEVYGPIAKRWLGAETPLAGIAGDQQAALFGQLGTQPGLVKNTYGTGCFLLLNTGNRPVTSRQRLLTTVAWRRGGKLTYALEGSVFVAGAAVQWLRDGLGLIRKSGEIEALAQSVPDNGGVYLVPAFTGLGAPYWDPAARGALLGLTRGSTAAHLARATLESMAHQTADLLEAMRKDARVPLRELRVDGGASANNLLMQTQADMLGVPVVRPTVTETTALGAAYLAGLAVGFWKDERELAALWKADRNFKPKGIPSEVRAERAHWKRAVARARGWLETN
ncbi:MAG TPA: glycerol kinase GlpK [Kiritimatiellia bacterium]|nr:glycerol kinase GlpK [Kiritimatiellia bacterium]